MVSPGFYEQREINGEQKNFLFTPSSNKFEGTTIFLMPYIWQAASQCYQLFGQASEKVRMWRFSLDSHCQKDVPVEPTELDIEFVLYLQ